jgi:hypothetical protein
MVPSTFPPVLPRRGKGAGGFWHVETGRSNFSPDEIVASVVVLGAHLVSRVTKSPHRERASWNGKTESQNKR